MSITPSSIWAIGDVQGCCNSLDLLLDQPAIASDEGARFWFAGDVVNRGPDSLAALRRVIEMGDRAITVLGNHDLHLLAVAAGIRPYGKSDTFNDILTAPDAEDLLDWVRHRPIAHYDAGHLLVHAGVLPAWDLQTTLALADEVQTALRAPDWIERMKKMYGNKPVAWRDDLGPRKRLRLIINAFTRMRLCNAEGHLHLQHKNIAADRTDLMPWFDVPGRAIRHEATIIFGHWSVLGLLIRPDVIGLDTGCVWGRQLSALRLHDQQLVQIECHQYRTPRLD